MRVILTGGGTGGHIYPALAIAEGLKKKYKGVEILYIGAKLGMEKDIVPKSGLKFKQIDVEPLNKKVSLKTVKSIFTLFKGLYQAKKEIKRFKPNLIIGTGGYVAGPIVMMGALAGIPTIIHEQNAFPGMTNRLLSRFVDRIFLTFDEAKSHLKHPERVVYTGLPVLESFYTIQREYARKRLGFAPDEFVVMTVGGSNGALKLNQIMMEAYENLREVPKLRIVHVSGDRYYERIQQKIKDGTYKVGPNFKLFSFMKEMPMYLNAVDLVVSRAGASTISEIIAAKTPSIVVPSPNVANNHQFHNAKVVDKNGMGIILKEEDLTSELMVHTVMDFYETPSKLEIMRGNCEKHEAIQSLDRILTEITLLLQEHDGL